MGFSKKIIYRDDDMIELNSWDKAKLVDIPIGHFSHDNTHVWKILNKCKNDYRNLCEIKCVAIIDREKAKFNVGDKELDHKDSIYQYIGKHRWEINLFLYFLISCYRKELMETTLYKKIKKWYDENKDKL